MKQMKKQIIIITVLIVFALMITLVVSCNHKTKENAQTNIKDNKAVNDVVVNNIKFKNITKVYNEGITTISAEMLNESEEVKSFTVEVILKDKDNNKIKSAFQVVENLEPNKVKTFTTGLVGSYSTADKVEFKIVE